jgi:hypothetical protein
MTARHRGDTRTHSRWRPAAQQLVAHEPERRELADDSRVRPRRTLVAVAVLAVAVITAMVVTVAVVVGKQGSGRAKGVPLPATPGRWMRNDLLVTSR